MADSRQQTRALSDRITNAPFKMVLAFITTVAGEGSPGVRGGAELGR
jgi:hypothetical protein